MSHKQSLRRSRAPLGEEEENVMGKGHSICKGPEAKGVGILCAEEAN